MRDRDVRPLDPFLADLLTSEKARGQRPAGDRQTALRRIDTKLAALVAAPLGATKAGAASKASVLSKSALTAGKAATHVSLLKCIVALSLGGALTVTAAAFVR